MNSEPTPDPELASAALDNEVSAAELERVRNDPNFTNELRGFATVRNQLREVDVPSAARESALAAALGVFDELRSPPAATSPDATMSSLALRRQRRQRQYRFVVGIAAATMIVVAGIAVINSGTSSDLKATTAAVSSKEVANDEVPDLRTAANTEAAPAAGAADAAQSTDAPANTTNEASETGVPALDNIGGPAQVSPWAAAPNLATKQELLSYVATLATASSAGTTDTTNAAIFSGCQTNPLTPLSPVIYQGVEVYIAVDPVGGAITVIEPTTCAPTEVIQP